MNKAREFTKTYIDTWKKELPLSELSTSTKAVYLLLEELRMASLSPKRRFEILCALRAPISYLSKNLQRFYSNQEILSEQQILISDLSEGLLRRMLEESKSVIKESTDSIFKTKLLLYALQNAMHYCISMLLHAYQQHRKPNPGLWLELHALYLLAQKKHLLNIPLPRVPEWDYQLKNIDSMYKHCLLFVLSSPFRIRRQQIIHLIYALELWTPLLNFSTTDADNALFVVDYESDAPPQYTSLAFHPNGEYNYLHLDKINKRLMKLIAFRRAEPQARESKTFTEAECKLPLLFVESLLSSWQHVAERTTPRHQVHDFINVTLGIASTYWFMTTHTQTTNKENNLNAESPVQYNTEIIDQSEGGYCLKWIEKIPPNLQNGEILGIASTKSGKTTWAVGTIRWLKQEKNNAVYIGVQILSAQAVGVTCKITDIQGTLPIPTLMLANNDIRPITLVTPLLPFKTGQDIDIDCLNKTYGASLRHIRSQSLSYQEFELTFMHESFVFDIEADIAEKNKGSISEPLS